VCYVSGMDISEAASEKRRRGRPRVLTGEWATAIERLRPEIKTDRGRQNFDYAYRAIRALSIGHEDRPLQGYEHLQWLVDWKRANQYRRGAVKWAILTELGRRSTKYGDEFAIKVADRVCKEKPEVKQGAAMIRRIRLGGKSPAPDGHALLGRLAACLDQYRAEHPKITTAEMLDAINEIYSIVQNADS
jgi:hypothetical protein